MTGSGNQYKEDQSITINESITLYSIWEREAPTSWAVIDKNDSSWYSYQDLSENNKKVTVNQPILKGEMAPIAYDGNDKDSQTGSKWANSITLDGSMWVWIPRFAYKITEGYHSNVTGTIDIAFINTKNEFLNGETGTITTNPTDVGAARTTWLVHPAFTSDANNGGGFGNLDGFWFGKFDTANTTEGLAVKPALNRSRKYDKK